MILPKLKGPQQYCFANCYGMFIENKNELWHYQ